ncbi:MAG: PTS IIA-like nitrogen-regulatory protein PtsN [Gammaproteobacteria bacterium]|nr:MAG: PTS IIA-like nitrogen-regulatory protein PtsN [Gammaproteobacteria bacterium]
MPTTGILSPSAIRLDDDSPSKKRALEHAAQLLAPDDVELSERIYERLLERERLGSTGLSGGVALPHARMPEIKQTRGAFLRLTTPIDFDSIDGRPVDLVFALLVPEEATEEHLKLLAELARMFNDPAMRNELRHAAKEQAYDLLTRHIAHDAA